MRFDFCAAFERYLSLLSRSDQQTLAGYKKDLIIQYDAIEDMWSKNLEYCRSIPGWKIHHLILSENAPIGCNYIYESGDIREEYRRLGIMVFDLLPIHLSVTDILPNYPAILTISIPYIDEKMQSVRDLFCKDPPMQRVVVYSRVYKAIKKFLQKQEGVFLGCDLETFIAEYKYNTAPIPSLKGKITNYLNNSEIDTVPKKI